MRNPAELHTGDDWAPAITLTTGGSIEPVPSGATVRAAITDQDGQTILAGPVTVLEATSGSDWANGVIVPIFPASLTVDLPTGYARTEVEVLHDGNVSTWSMSRTPRIEPGVITNLTLEPEPGESLSDINAAELGSGAATDGYVLTADGAGGADWEAIPAAGGALTAADIDTLAELNTIITDATLDDASAARTPTAHAASHATGGSDAIAPADIGAATDAQGALADTAVQPARAVNSGTGLEGGGDLSADRTLALDAATIASLALADTATQPGDLATVATTGAYADLSGKPTIPTTALPVPFVLVTTSKTLALSDSEVEQRVDSASAVVLTIPTNAAVAFADNSKIPVMGIGTGTVTITASAGVTLNGVSTGSAALSAQYSAAVLTKVGTDAWVINGDHGAVA